MKKITAFSGIGSRGKQANNPNKKALLRSAFLFVIFTAGCDL